MPYFVNDTIKKITLLPCLSLPEAKIYATWAQEYDHKTSIDIERSPCKTSAQGDILLAYYGFTIDTLVENVFACLPSRSQSVSNKRMIKMLLRHPELSKNECCILIGKEPTHYSRVSKLIGHHCKRISVISGGRNPMRLMREIRSDL